MNYIDAVIFKKIFPIQCLCHQLVYCFGQWLFLSSSIFRLSIFLFSTLQELTSSDTAY